MTAAPGPELLRVLVADGDPDVRSTVLEVLRERDHDVEIACDGPAAWRAIEDWQPDLVVLDLDLETVSGLEVCRRVRELDQEHETFMLFLAGGERAGALESILDAGGDEFIAKPASAGDVRARLMLAERRLVQDRARRWAEAQLAKSRWLSGIVEATLSLQHEINNPLSAVLGNAELMMMELNDKGERNELVEVIHEQAMRVAEVVRRLRQLRNPESVDYVGGSRMINFWKEQVT